MIRVSSAPEPASFNDLVRAPGQRYLNSIAPRAKPNFTNRNYWKAILPELHSAYHNICAYSCHWMPLDTGADTVEHFVPKSLDPARAYEWQNYRLACARLNGRKGNFQDVVDPFRVHEGMFHLHFPSLCVVPGRIRRRLANSTIERLKLNESRCVETRRHYVENYLNGEITISYLRRHAPFLGLELVRQHISKKQLARFMGR
jgi:hypothetical protein